MAVCNLFNNLTSNTGNFMLFSQYVEDATRNITEGDNYKVIPSKFVAMDIDYSKISVDFVLNKNTEHNLNKALPKFFQNYFENACAYGRTHYKKFTDNKNEWTSEISKNLFWNSLFDGNFISIEQYGSDESNIYRVPEIVYYNDINMHSYNEHQGMGYSEIYCYIPTSAPQMNCQVVAIEQNGFDRKYDVNTSMLLEGHNIEIENYSKNYFYNKDFNLSFDDEDIDDLAPLNNSKYNINTIVVMYSVFRKINNEWITLYSNIPMGIYFTGKFEEFDDVSTNISTNITNNITKYVSTSYDTGTSYGIRICTRFSAAPNGTVMSNHDISIDNSGYSNLCQLMSSMKENLSKMLEVTKSNVDTTNQLKEIYSILKNNRTNVPYVKEVNGLDCWFVNGKFVSTVSNNIDNSCIIIPEKAVQDRLDNLEDSNTDNDYTSVFDGLGLDECEEFSPRVLAEELGLETIGEDGKPIYPDSGFVTEIVKNCDCDTELATEEEITKELELGFEIDYTKPPLEDYL